MIDLQKIVNRISKVADFSDLEPKSIKEITDAIILVNEFNSKINSYGINIFATLFLDTLDGWKSRLSESDINKAFGKKGDKVDKRRDDYKSVRYVLCYETMTLHRYDGYRGWSMGASTGRTTNCVFSDIFDEDGKIMGQNMVIIEDWSTKSARFNHIPWVRRERRFTINLSTKSVVVSGDGFSES